MNDLPMRRSVMSIYRISNGRPVLYAKNVDIRIIVWVESLIQGVVLAASMTKVQQPEQCLTSVNFHCSLPFILPSK